VLTWQLCLLNGWCWASGSMLEWKEHL